MHPLWSIISNPRRRLALGLLLALGVAVWLRGALINGQGLWADEIFSLAMATGHSLEHPAHEANPALGDYSEFPRAVSPSTYHHYTVHEDPAPGPGRVLRAVQLSDTSPPLYYLVLYAWTRALGTSDTALYLF